MFAPMKLNKIKTKEGDDDIHVIQTDAMTFEEKMELRRLQEEGIERQVTMNIAGGDYKKTG